MIQTDPEFYRKVVALNQITTRKLKITVMETALGFMSATSTLVT